MWQRASQAAVPAVGKPPGHPLPGRVLGNHPAAPGSTAPAFPPMAGDSLAVHEPPARSTRLVGSVVAAVAIPRIPRAKLKVAGIPTTAPTGKTPLSRPIPGRKIRPRHPPSRIIPTAPERTLSGAVDGPSRPGKAPYRPEPGVPAVMCRQPAANRGDRVLQGSVGHPQLYRPTDPGPVPQGQRPEAAPPAPARQEQHRMPPRRNGQMLHSPARQERVRVSLPVPPIAPAIPGAAAR